MRSSWSLLFPRLSKPIIYVIDKTMKENRSQDRPLRDTTHHCLHLDMEPLTTTLRIWPSNQFFIHIPLHVTISEHFFPPPPGA